MENSNKKNRMTEEMKTFEHLMRDERNKKQAPDPGQPEDRTPAELLMEVSGTLLECFLKVAEAALLLGFTDDEEDEDDEDPCCDCPCDGNGGSCCGTMVLVAHPDGYNSILTMDELAEEIGDIFGDQPGTYDMKPVPGTEDLYFVIAEKRPMRRTGRNCYRKPAVVFRINEEAGEVVSPHARQLYTAARYFEDAATTVRTREGDISVFCFD